MEPLITRNRILVVVVAGCVLVAVGDWIYDVSTEVFVAYIGTLVATFTGVGAAAYLNVRVFDEQERKRARERTDLLAQSLAGELFTVLDILGGMPNVRVRDVTYPEDLDKAIPGVFA